MKKILKLYASAALTALALSVPMASAGIFLDIDGIEGESNFRFHQDEIDVVSWGWSLSRNPTGQLGGSGSSAPNFQDITVFKGIDKASPNLYQSIASGKTIKEATLTVRSDSDDFVFTTVKMTNILVTSASTGSTVNDEGRPIESITLNFAEVEITNIEQNVDGSVGTSTVFCWNIETNLGC